MTFSSWNHECHWRKNDTTMIRKLLSRTKRRISKDVLCFPYLASKGLCITWSLHALLIFYHTLGFLVCLFFSLAPWELSICSFREASGYLLHNFQGTMMQMTKNFVPKFIDIGTCTFSPLVLNAAQSSTSSLYRFFTRTQIYFTCPMAMCLRNAFALLNITSQPW